MVVLSWRVVSHFLHSMEEEEGKDEYLMPKSLKDDSEQDDVCDYATS